MLFAIGLHHLFTKAFLCQSFTPYGILEHQTLFQPDINSCLYKVQYSEQTSI